MSDKINLRKLYITIIFPIYVLSNLLSASSFAFADEGAINYFAELLSYIRYVIYIISIFYACTRHIKKKPLVYATLFTLLVLACLVVNRNVTFLCSLFVFWALVDFKWETILQKHHFVALVTLLVFLFFSQIGVIEDFVRLDGRTRHFLGFNWTTYAPIIWFFVTLGGLCINSDSHMIARSLGYGIVTVILYKLTGTRLAFGLTVVSIIFFLGFKHLKRHKKLFHFITSLTICAPIVCAVLSILVHAIYRSDNPFLFRLNELLSQRLYLGKMGLTNYGVTLWGQKIKWIGFNKNIISTVDYNAVDCTYLHLLLEYGLVFTLVYIILLTAGFVIAYKHGKYNMCWALCFICILGMTEPWLFNFTFNPFMFCGVALFQKLRATKATIIWGNLPFLYKT